MTERGTPSSQRSRYGGSVSLQIRRSPPAGFERTDAEGEDGERVEPSQGRMRDEIAATPASSLPLCQGGDSNFIRYRGVLGCF